jgi:hypothetical protein
MADADVAGNASVTVVGGSGLGLQTASGSTTATLVSSLALMSVEIPAGAFNGFVPFTITELTGPDLAVQSGATNEGAAIVTPLAAYRFAFDVPTLNADATLSFTVALSAPLLNALATGQASLAVKGDAVGDVYQVYPVCAAGQPASTTCAAIELLDGTGAVVTDPAQALFVRFAGLTGHFSSFAVVLVAPDGDGDGVTDDNDNCPATANPDQADADNDAIGDVCDPTPDPISVSISGGQVTEGHGGTIPLTFTVTLSGASSQAIAVSYMATDGSAVQPGDYTRWPAAPSRSTPARRRTAAFTCMDADSGVASCQGPVANGASSTRPPSARARSRWHHRIRPAIRPRGPLPTRCNTPPRGRRAWANRGIRSCSQSTRTGRAS